MQLINVKIEKPDDTNFVLGQTHFIKSVEDIHEALVAAVPGIKFGLAFCEASGKCLVRWSGTDPAMTELADITSRPALPPPPRQQTAQCPGQSPQAYPGPSRRPRNPASAARFVASRPSCRPRTVRRQSGRTSDR